MLGYCHLHREWAWREAEEEYRRALKLNPGSALCHLCYAEFLRLAGRMEDAPREINVAKGLDEDSSIINYRLASYLVDARQFHSALDQLKVVRVVDSTRDVSYVEIEALTALGRYLEAIECWCKAQAAKGKPEDWIKKQADPHRAAVEFEGATAYWNVRLRFAQEDHDIYWQACCYAQLYDTNQALAILTAAASRTNTMLTFRIMTDWKLDPVRSDPRFREILKKMHLAPPEPQRLASYNSY